MELFHSLLQRWECIVHQEPELVLDSQWFFVFNVQNRAELDREPQNGANASPSNGRKKIPGMVPGMTQKQSASAQQPPKIDPAIRPQSAAQKNEKKIKQVTKKLKAIQDIKDKVALGLQVELTQIEKMKNEDALMRELAELTQESLSLLNS